MMKRRIFLTGLLSWPVAALAHSYKAGDIAVGHAWALPSQQTDGQVFVPMLNGGKADDALVAVRSNAASLVELRQNNHYDDAPLQQFALPPGRPFPMRPTAHHLRLVGLSKPLVKGDRFKIVLDFLNAGEIEIEVHVQDKPAE
jgi:periplasmic copper chaperone A